jgi:acyl-CoA reductase-like NAD-dependent aldehyde dehydrogenase
MATDVKHHQMFINGKHVDSDEMDEIRDPATEEVVYATIARGTAEHADAAVAAARAAFESATMPRSRRLRSSYSAPLYSTRNPGQLLTSGRLN